MTLARQPTDEQKRGIRRELGLATALIATGLVISGLSLAELVAHGGRDMVQATPGTATPESKPEPGGARPTTPSPEPLRADAQAKTQQGASPLLPPEEAAPPIK